MRTMSGGPCTHYDCTNRNSFGYCKTTACINQNYSTDWIGSTANKAYQVVSKPVTNADRIRSMTDEELAELLTAVAQKSANKLCESLKSVEVDLSNCNFHLLYEAHLDWLKEGIEEGK